ncbi:MAG TPA: DHHA1 domain-containing protein, partial [Candidatus Bathyarchaeia archaeon]|nr:DHHA1 domain-containing protein [Candidatus Bathyarchaeia archaeon]
TKNRLIFISHKSYNQGVIGLVAGKLVEEFYQPAIVISEAKNYSKGSCRSVKGFDVIRFLRKLSNFFEDLGGHPMAAGFTIKTNKIKGLKAKLTKLTQKEIKDKWLKPVLQIDLEINLVDVSWKLFNEIEKFAPFGLGNPRPTFVSRNVKVLEARSVGRENKHLKLKLGSPKNTSEVLYLKKYNKNNSSEVKGSDKVIFNSIAFKLGHLSPKLSQGQLIDICFTIEKNVWNGDESLELKLKDLKF